METPFLSCVHTHTTFCDGAHTPKEMVQAALEQGFVSLGFSGHSCVEYDDAAMTPNGEKIYQAEIRRLQQKYAGRIEILLGLEHEGLTPYSDFPYEYQIESVHHIPANGVILDIDYSKARADENIRTHFHGDPYAYCSAYFRHCAAAYENSPAQIAGHLDLVTKFNEGFCQFDETDPRYLAAALEALDCALDRGLVPELNTGAISRGYRTKPYPSVPLLKRILERRSPIIVTSDCHNKFHLTCWYPEAAQLLRDCGFRSTLVLRKTGFQELSL